MMKNLLFTAAIAALAFTGCSTEETSVSPTPPQGIPVDFSTGIVEVTRGVPVAGAQFGENAEIGVFGTEKLVDAATASWMDNVCLTRDADGNWAYDNVRYFLAGYKYTFIAYAPYKSVDAPSMATPTTVSYTVPTAIADQKDFMYSNSVALDYSATAPAADAKVVFTFKHALAQVKFSALTTKDYSDSYTLTVKSVSLADIASTGSLNCVTDSWTASSNPLVTYIQTIKDGLNLSTAQTQLASATDGEVLMLIPQDPAGKKLTLTLNVVATAKGNALLNGDKTIELNIPANNAWVAGHVYNYKISLNLDSTLGVSAGISDPTITEWGQEEEIPM